MEKNAFLRELALILRERKLSEGEIGIRIEKISAFIDNLSQEERNALIGGEPNVAAIADRLFSRDTSATQARKPAPPAGKPAATQRKKEGADSQFKIRSDYEKTAAMPKPEPTQNSRTDAEEIRRRDEEKLKKLKSEAQKPKRRSGEEISLVKKYEGERKFWVIFFSCIPVLFILATMLLSVFAAIFFGLIALIIVLVALLAAAVAVGSAIAIIGIGYGILTIFTSTAIGLYEVGLGILAAGITMLFGVLIYNAAIRFIPWIMRKLRVFFKFVLRKLGVLAEYLKGVCALI